MQNAFASPGLLLAAIAFTLLFSIPSVQCALKMLRHYVQRVPLPIQRHERYALLVAPVVGYLLLGMLSTEIELLDWKHLVSVLAFSALSIALYFVSRTSKEKVGPLLLALIPSALLAGILLLTVEYIHFLPVIELGVVGIIILLGLIVVPAFSLVQAVILLATELYIILDFNRQRVLPAAAGPSGSWLWKLYFGRYHLLAQLLTFPLFVTVVQVALLVLAQQPDSLAQAFLASKDGVFSQGSCDNCVSTSVGTSEYVCTIAGFGSPWLVKPLCWGSRHGYPIRVTRQLQVCNAFEEWLADVAPSVQHRLRKWYDSLQISIEKWRQVRLVANALYLLLKPLEWIFLLVLYLFARRPEARIARQYLPVASAGN